MPLFEKSQFEKPSMPSIEKPEKIEEKEPTREKKIGPAEEIKIPEKKEPTEAGDNLKLKQIRSELKKLQKAEASEKLPEIKKEEKIEERVEDPRNFLKFEKMTQPKENLTKIAEGLRGKTERETIENTLTFLGDNLKNINLEQENPKKWKETFRKLEAQEILKSRVSYGCTDTTVLFLTLIRGGGIPAKFIEGKRIGKSGTHSWAEVFIDGKWIGVDPTQGIKGMEFKPDESDHGPYKVISESLGPSDSMITSYKDWRKIEKAWDYKKNVFKKEIIGFSFPKKEMKRFKNLEKILLESEDPERLGKARDELRNLYKKYTNIVEKVYPEDLKEIREVAKKVGFEGFFVDPFSGERITTIRPGAFPGNIFWPLRSIERINILKKFAPEFAFKGLRISTIHEKEHLEGVAREMGLARTLAEIKKKPKKFLRWLDLTEEQQVDIQTIRGIEGERYKNLFKEGERPDIINAAVIREIFADFLIRGPVSLKKKAPVEAYENTFSTLGTKNTWAMAIKDVMIRGELLKKYQGWKKEIK